MRGVVRTTFERESLVAACRASGLSPKAFAEREHLPPSTLYQWLAKSPPVERAVRLARVIRRTPASDEAVVRRPTAAPLILELGVARVSVGAGFDRSLLAELLDVLEARCHKEPS